MEFNFFSKLLENTYDLINYDEEEEIKTYTFDDYHDLFIEVDKINNTFNIFVEFVHPLYDYEEYEHEGLEQVNYSTYFKSILKDEFIINPQIEGDDYIGAPFDNEKVGYFKIPYDLNFIEIFIRSYDTWMAAVNINSKGICTEDVLKRLEYSKWEVIKNKTINRGYIDKDFYVKRYDFMAISLRKSKQKLSNEIKIDFNNLKLVEYKYYGIKNVLFKTDVGILTSDRDLYEEVINLIEDIEDVSDIKLFTDEENIIYIESESLVAIIPLLKINVDRTRIEEYKYLSQAMIDFKVFAPPQMIEEINFDNLDGELFEKLCFEFLECEGYRDIHPLGKANASDGGCDLFAKDYNGHDWIIQCKHSRRKNGQSFSRSMFSEIPDILEENYSDRYLLIATHDLTPQIVKRIKLINSRQKEDIIHFLPINEFKLSLTKYPKLIYKFKLLENGSEYSLN